MGDRDMSRQLTSGVLRRKKADVWLYKGEVWEYEEVTSPHTGRVWMDRNLGAERVALNADDALATGDLFQWGRLDDLHQNRDSLVTDTIFEKSDSDAPNNNGKFIQVGSGQPQDWRDPQNDNLWQPSGLINVPAPSGWRLPSQSEIQAEADNFTQSKTGAFNSFLALASVELRRPVDGDISTQNDTFLWTHTTGLTDTTRSIIFRARNTSIIYQEFSRAWGIPVRLIKEI